MDEIETLLQAAGTGQPGERDALFAGAYDELCKLARARLRGGGRGTCLDTVDLVHESYFRMSRCGPLSRVDRAAFFAYASRVMRSVIVDTVRKRQADRRGGGWIRQTLDTPLLEGLPAEADEVLEVDGALESLAAVEPRLAQIVEMRYFGGHSEDEIADALGISTRTVRRDWEKARLMLGAMLAT